MEKSNQSKTSLGVRKPIEEVFQAFIDPDITTKFWFTHSTGILEEGKSITWKWQMYNLEVPVKVLEIVQNQKIVIEWGEGKDVFKAKWEFQEVDTNLTFVTIIGYDFLGNGDELIKQVQDATQGFTFVLSGLKFWLEHRIKPNLIEDVFPKELINNA